MIITITMILLKFQTIRLWIVVDFVIEFLANNADFPHLDINLLIFGYKPFLNFLYLL